MTDLFNPTPEHHTLRQSLRRFAETEVEAQAAAHDREERFNLPLFRKLGELGLLGLTVPEEHGGAGMDAARGGPRPRRALRGGPGLHPRVPRPRAALREQPRGQRQRRAAGEVPPDACSGAKVGGMCMSEPGAGTDVLGMRTTRGAPRRHLRAQRRQDVDHQRRHQRHRARRRVSGLRPRRRRCRATSSRCSSSRRASRASRSGRRSRTSSACAPRPRRSSSSRTARCPEKPRRRRGRRHHPHDAQPRDRAHGPRGHEPRHRAPLHRGDEPLRLASASPSGSRCGTSARSSATSPSRTRSTWPGARYVYQAASQLALAGSPAAASTPTG
jgi:hypothetical protein